MKITRSFLPILILSAALLSGGCKNTDTKAAGSTEASRSSSLQVLTIGTADSGGTMSPVGKAIAQVISDSDNMITVNVSASNGSASNVRSLYEGSIDLGLVSGDVAFAAVNGEDEFSGTPVTNLRAVAAVYPSLSNWIALSSSGFSFVHDLKGARIGIGPQYSTTELAANIVLKSMGITKDNSTLENCGLGSGASEVAQGGLDAVHGFTGIPINSMKTIANAYPCTVLKYTKEELNSIIRTNPFYYQDVIPAGTYAGQDTDVPTFGIKCLLCVREDMDEELVYELTSILYDNAKTLGTLHPALSSMEKGGFMYELLPIGLHAGAERFYREKGLLAE